MEENYELISAEAEAVDHLLSERRMPLVAVSGRYAYDEPLLTVEYYVKWYALYLVKVEKPAGADLPIFSIYKIHFGHLDGVRPDGVSAYCDHVPNPLVVRIFAARYGYHLDELADDLITGRWQNEYVDQMGMQCDRCEGAGCVPLPNDPSGIVPSTCRACKGHGVFKPGA